MRGKLKKNLLFTVITTVVFAAVGALLISTHEPTLNAANSLFYQLGLSYSVGSYLSLAIVTIAAFLLCLLTRFSKLQKIFIMLSAGFLYFPYVDSGFGFAGFVPGAKMDYLEFSKQLNESLFGMLIPIFEFGLVFLLIYLYARHLKLFFAALLTFGAYLSALYFFAPAPLSSGMTVPLLTLAVLFIALSFLGRRRGRNCCDRFFGRMETYKLLKSYVSVRSLCLVFVFLSVPHAVFASIHDLTTPVSDAYVVSEAFNELPENSVILSASEDIERGISPYARLLTGGREIYNTPVTDENLDEIMSRFEGRNIYIVYGISTCGKVADNITIKDDWETKDFNEATKNTLTDVSLVRATGLEPAQLKIATTTSR